MPTPTHTASPSPTNTLNPPPISTPAPISNPSHVPTSTPKTSLISTPIPSPTPIHTLSFTSPPSPGGYSYRLCKLPKGGISAVTEECFQDLPLDFAGDKQWVVYQGDHSTGKRTEIPAQRTSKGTFPHGSQWTANPLWPMKEEGGDQAHGQGEVIDQVVVPASLEPGEYVLSFRWDCKCSPQVWGSCASVTVI